MSMNNFLAIDSSSRYLTVLAQKGEKQTFRHLSDCAMRHSVILMDEVDKALKEIDLAPSECDFFAAVTGPGSFTGIRIGISTAKGFATALDKPLASLTSFELIAYNVEDENFYVVIDAAHGAYYVCGYGKDKKEILPPCYMPESEVINLNANLYGFENLNLPRYRKLDAGECLLKAVKAGKKSNEMHALYVRKSQAEEGRK